MGKSKERNLESLHCLKMPDIKKEEEETDNAEFKDIEVRVAIEQSLETKAEGEKRKSRKRRLNLKKSVSIKEIHSKIQRRSGLRSARTLLFSPTRVYNTEGIL